MSSERSRASARPACARVRATGPTSRRGFAALCPCLALRLSCAQPSLTRLHYGVGSEPGRGASLLRFELTDADIQGRVNSGFKKRGRCRPRTHWQAIGCSLARKRVRGLGVSGSSDAQTRGPQSKQEATGVF